MKAAVCERYGPPEAVVIKEVPMPVVNERDVLIRVRTTAVTIADARVRALRVPRGFAIPTRLAMGILRPRHPIFATRMPQGACTPGATAQVEHTTLHASFESKRKR